MDFAARLAPTTALEEEERADANPPTRHMLLIS
jgi:hypothetical protein